jgi:hypothetical protein
MISLNEKRFKKASDGKIHMDAPGAPLYVETPFIKCYTSMHAQ